MYRNQRFRSKFITTLLLCVLMLTLVLPVEVLASGVVEPDKDVALTVYFKDGTTPISGTEFDLYRVADVDPYANMTLTSAFSSYPVQLEGLDQEGWLELAMTLNGYTKRDQLTPLASAAIDEAGQFSVTMQPGLYLLLGERMTIGGVTYFPTPFMLFLPGRDAEKDIWNYEVTADVKYTKEPVSEVVTRKVLKIWEDAGFESLRPQEITMQLLCDGEVYDTQRLSAENEWGYTWENLAAGHEWLIVEEAVDGYYTTQSQDGITVMVTNQYKVPSPEKLPVVKKITGDTPSSQEAFLFTLRAESEDAPMPEGSSGRTKEITINGAGMQEMGEIHFSAPGEYVYTVAEKDTGVKGYIYDKTVYTVTYTVTEEEGKMAASCRITDDTGRQSEVPVFTNRYSSDPRLPQTGLLWWPVPILLLVGITLCVAGVLRKRKRG